MFWITDCWAYAISAVHPEHIKHTVCVLTICAAHRQLLKWIPMCQDNCVTCTQHSPRFPESSIQKAETEEMCVIERPYYNPLVSVRLLPTSYCFTTIRKGHASKNAIWPKKYLCVIHKSMQFFTSPKLNTQNYLNIFFLRIFCIFLNIFIDSFWKLTLQRTARRWIVVKWDLVFQDRLLSRSQQSHLAAESDYWGNPFGGVIVKSLRIRRQYITNVSWGLC